RLDLMRVADAPWTPAQQAVVSQVGLSGAQLNFKLGTFRLLSRLDIIDRGKKRFWRKVAEWLVKILKQVNTILASLAKAFPPLEAVKEFKETLENILDCGDLVDEEFEEPL
ncbi:MAG TPA: hypothetical protein VK458_32270, partial [Myxococcaceae bacterium]|nr:hypothetical protein [Myxococcaceae bacterium]